MNSIIKSAAKITEELSQLGGNCDAKQDKIQHTKERLGEVLKKKCKNVMHRQYIMNMDRQLISEEYTILWLSKGDLKAETESEIVAAQDQALNTNFYATKVLNTETESKCRLCLQFDETRSYNITMTNTGKRTICKTA
jgi:Ni,Fe-hydrogenase III component G